MRVTCECFREALEEVPGSGLCESCRQQLISVPTIKVEGVPLWRILLFFDLLVRRLQIECRSSLSV